MSKNVNRRSFVKGAATVGTGFWVSGIAPKTWAQSKSPNEKVNIAGVGVGGRGAGDVGSVSRENIVALCDVDWGRAGDTFNRFDKAKKFKDYRVMLDKMEKEIDAVVVATPDHMHAPVSLNAMRRGLHCYTEKPLTWSLEEAKLMAKVAKEKKLITQMGNQGSANSGFRQGVEMLQAGVLGEVRELIVWTNRPVWPQAVPTPPAETPPDNLAWDLWLGCAEKRPYSSKYLPFAWRGWYDFGTGALGDMACHTVNLAYRGLKLTEPTKIESESTKLFDESYPAGAKITTYYPEREGLPPLKMTWYEGQMRPPADVMPKELLPANGKIPGSGLLAVGSKGYMFSPDDYGAKQDWHPGELAEVSVPRTLPRSRGHHYEWIARIKDSSQPMPYSNFEIAGPFTASMLLGNLSVRLGKTIMWDAEKVKATNAPEAEPLIRRKYRNGFGIEA